MNSLPGTVQSGVVADDRAHSARAHARTILLVLAAFSIAFFAQALLIKLFAVNMPFWDEWSTNPQLLLSYRAGTLTWQSLFAQHNEHRILNEKLLLLGTFALLEQWSPIANMLVSALLVGCIAAILAYTLRRLELPAWVGLLSSLILVSPTQFENIVWGFQTSFYTLVLSTLIGISVIALSRRVSWPVVLAAIIACFFGTFSILSGLLTWGVVGACLLLKALLAGPTLRSALRDRKLWAKAALFCAVAVAHIVFYFFYHYNLVVRPDAQARSVERLLRWVTMALAYPFVSFIDHPAIVLVGGALLLWVPIMLAIALLIRRRREVRAQQQLVLFVGLVLFVIGNVLVVGYGRASLGNGLASRYITIFQWGSLLCLLAIAELLNAARALPARIPRLALVGLVCLVCMGLLLAHERRAVIGLGQIRNNHTALAQMRQTVVSYLNDPSPNRQLGNPMPFPAQGKAVLKQRLDNPAIVALLPAALHPAPDPGKVSRAIELMNGFFNALVYLAAVVGTALWMSYLALA